MPTIYNHRTHQPNQQSGKKRTMKSSSVKRRNLPQRQRARRSALPGFRLTKRDRAIVAAVHAYRALTTKQIERLFFPSTGNKQSAATGSRCLHRLKLLYHHHFLLRGEQSQLLAQGRKPFVYFLDRAGAELLANQAGCTVRDLDWRPGEYQVGHLFLDHLLATNDVRIAVELAARKHGFTIEKWLDEKTLKSGHMKETVTLVGPQGAEQQAAVVPDGYFHLYADDHHYHQFLEVDMRTVTGASHSWSRRTWQRKVKAYLAYYRSGQYHERYHTKGMRILCVTTGEKRLANLLAITEKTGGKSRFWFTTFEEVEEADILLDPIWRVAGREEKSTLVW